MLANVLNYMERQPKSSQGKKVCIAAIYDPEAFERCHRAAVGEDVSVSIGVGDQEYSGAVALTGVLKAKGQLLGYLGSESDAIGQTCTVAVGDVDIVITDKASSFVSVNHFTAAGLDLNDYDVIVVKQGYLFDELSKLAQLAIFALTPGATDQRLERIPYRHLPRPIYPFDDV